MQNNIVIRLIDITTSDYEKEIKLRDEVLRKPIGLSIYEEDLGDETRDYHLGVFDDNELIGILILTILSESELKMRQVGVKESLRGKNIGTQLVSYAESFAKGLGYRTIVLNARKNAADFYERMSYEKKGDLFIEVGIEHYRMEKVL